MHFAYPLPWWLAVLIAAAIAAVTYVEYWRPLAPLTPRQRAVLAACRASVLAILVLFLLRPIVLAPPEAARDAVVPVLVEASPLFTPADIEWAARKAAQRAFEREHFAGGGSRATTEDFLSAIAETRATLTPAMVAEFDADTTRFSRA